MPVERCDDVVRGNGLAVMKFDALAQLENPLGGIRAGFERFGEQTRQLTIRTNLGQTAVQRRKQEVGVPTGQLGGIELVGGRALNGCDPQVTAIFWRHRLRFAEQRAWNNGSQAQGPGSLHKVTPRDFAFFQAAH